MENTYPRETVENVIFEPVVVDGVTVTDFDYSIVKHHERPTTWADAIDAAGGEKAFPLNGPALGRGDFAVYVRVGTVVIKAGELSIE